MARFDDLVKQSKDVIEVVNKQIQIKAEVKRLIAIPTEDAEVVAALDLDLRSQLVDAVVSNKDATLLCELSAAIAEQAKQKKSIEQHKRSIQEHRAEFLLLDKQRKRETNAIIQQLARYK
jgi:hypothetical protein